MLYELSTPHLAKGHLKQVPEEWCPPYSGHHLYYASRRQPTPAFAFLVDVAVKYLIETLPRGLKLAGFAREILPAA